MNINFGKYEATIKDGVATFFVPVNADKDNPLSKENAKVEYKVNAVFEKGRTKIKHLWIVDKQELKY